MGWTTRGGGSGIQDGILQMSDAVKLQTFGKHLASKYDGDSETYVYNATTLMDNTGSIETFYLEYQPVEYRIITHGNTSDKSGINKDGASPEIIGDYTEDAVGTFYEYTVVPSNDYIMSRIYYKLGATLNLTVGDSISLECHHGTVSDPTKLLFKSTVAVGSTGQTLAPNGKYISIFHF